MLPVAGEQSICERSCHFAGAACVSSLENLGRAGRWSLRNCSHHGKNDFEVDCTLRCLTYSLHHGHQHTNSTLQADEEVWTEIDRYKGRSEERSVGKECVRKCRIRWSWDHTKKKK